MGLHQENKSSARKAISTLINKLKAESDSIANQAAISPASLEELKSILKKLEHEISVYSYLDANQEEEPKIEKKEEIIVPPPPAYIPAVQFEKIPVEMPIIKEPVPQKEIPTIIPPRSQVDVKSFIGFNEKIMFLRSLFNGETHTYDDVIAQINACRSLEEANSYLSVISSSYKWKMDSEPVQIFQSVVKRRFS